MLDFTDVPVIDNHCHPIDPGKTTLDPESLAREFFHGIGDIPKPDVEPRFWGATDELRPHFFQMGVVHTMVCLLSRLFGCPAELETVVEERNRRAQESFAAYARLLYEDARIVATVLDSGRPKNDPLFDLMPGKLMRLFQMDPLIHNFLAQAGSFKDLLQRYQEALESAVRDEVCVGVKSHLAEQVGFGVSLVSHGEAAAAFEAASAGDTEAYRRVYAAIFAATLLQCQGLGVSVHLHSGFTGVLWNGPLSNADPFLLAPFLQRQEFLKTKVVLLHCGYPWIQHAALVAHALPHVWIDMGWVTPWLSLRIAECFQDVMGVAPLSKLMIGSGGHGIPEIAWLAAKTAKIGLAEVLGNGVRLGLIDSKQASAAGRMILHDNAARMYRLVT